MKAALLANVNAGSSEGEFSIESITGSLKAAGIEFTLLDVAENENLTINDIKDKYELVISAGGDGTVNFAANILIGSDIPLAVIPAGTLNHFAKDIGMPLKLEDVIAVIKSGNVKKLDAASLNEHIFVNNSSIGLYALAVREREILQSRQGKSKWSAMLSAFISVFRRFPLYTVKITTEGRSETFRSPIIFIGNNEYKLDLFSLGTRNNLDKGILSIYVAICRTRMGIIRMIFSALLNRLSLNNDFDMLLVHEMEIHTRKHSLDTAFDGEVRKIHAPIIYKSLPGQLKIITPSD